MKHTYTYILFGKLAVGLFNLSLVHLLNAKNIQYTVGKFNNVADFFEEKKKWSDFIEIEYEDYFKIKNHLDKSSKTLKKQKKKFSFFKLFR